MTAGIIGLLVMGIGAALVGYIPIMILSRRGRKDQAKMLADIQRVLGLSLDEARRKAWKAIDDISLFRSLAEPPDVGDKIDALPALTREFFTIYKRIQSNNGAVVLTRAEIGGSSYNQALTKIGHLDYCDIIVMPNDAICEIDGSEPQSYVPETFPSVYHWIIQAAINLYPDRVDEIL